MAACAKQLNAQARTDEKCRGHECGGELVRVHRSSSDDGAWWKCDKCKASHMSPLQAEKEAFCWGGPTPPVMRCRGAPHATLDEQQLRAKQGLRVYTVEASIWLHGPSKGRRFAELGLNYPEALIMSQVRDRLSTFGQERLERHAIQLVWPGVCRTPGGQEARRVWAIIQAARAAQRQPGLPRTIPGICRAAG